MLIATAQAVTSRLLPEFPTTVTWTTVILGILVTVLILKEITRFLWKQRSTGGSKAIPGPWGLPLLGNILQLGSAPHITFKQMARKYGDIFQIRIGSRPVVVLNGYNTIRQALIKQSIDFAGRPDLESSRVMETIFGRSLAFSSYSDGWKLHRKITESTLRQFTSGSKVQSVGERISREAKELIEVWTSQDDQEDPKFKSHHFNVLKLSVSNVMYSYIFGRRHSLDDQKLLDFVDMSDAFSQAIGSGNPADFMPWIRNFSTKIHNNFVRMMHIYKDWFGKDIANHVDMYADKSEANILDTLITVYRRMDPETMKNIELTEEMVTNGVTDMFGAGFETITAGLQWAMALMIVYPGAQRDLQAELDAVVGHERTPNVSDRGRLPLTESCILEIFRYSSIVPMTIPHSTTRDTELNGYFIPKDTVVFVNLHSMHHDEATWDRPDEFRPRRFLNKEGTGLDPHKTILVTPFGIGRRRCIGSELARLEFFLYFSTLIHQCSFEAAKGDFPQMVSSPGLVQKPLPFNMIVRKRATDIAH